MGVNRWFVGQWVKAAAQSGEAVLEGRPRGPLPGRAESAEGRGVRHGEIETKQTEEAVDHAFGLAQGQAEHGSQRHVRAVVIAKAEYDS